MVARRALLVGAGAAAAAVTGAVAVSSIEDALPGEVPLRRALGLVGVDGAVPNLEPVPTRIDRFRSAARGREVTMVTMRPQPGLPVCVVLHGRYTDARGMIDVGLPRFLAVADRAGVPPFTCVAVDGGDSYWVAREAADDPQAMLRAELPGWLVGLGLAAPRAVLGISMGGFGGLVYAREVAVTAVLSPALFRSWDDARSVHGFTDERQWAANEPLRHLVAMPGGPRLGVWCGREDPFYPAARTLAEQTRAATAEFDHGAHTVGYWRRVLPSALRFVGQHLNT